VHDLVAQPGPVFRQRRTPTIRYPGSDELARRAPLSCAVTRELSTEREAEFDRRDAGRTPRKELIIHASPVRVNVLRCKSFFRPGSTRCERFNCQWFLRLLSRRLVFPSYTHFWPGGGTAANADLHRWGHRLVIDRGTSMNCSKRRS